MGPMWAVIRFCTYMADLTLVVSRTSRVGGVSCWCQSNLPQLQRGPSSACHGHMINLAG